MAAGQDNSELFDKAPAPIDEALRARVTQFYQAYMAGKFRDAYALVADDSQDAFMSSDKSEYRDCEILKIGYGENFTTAKVIESCRGEMRFQGHAFETKMPLQTNWKVVDGKWYWCYVKPKFAPTPFSPTGFVPIPDDAPATPKSILPRDPAAEAHQILGMVKVDKTAITLHSYENSKAEVHVRNDMPGWVTVGVDTITQPGLRATVVKPQLGPHEETAVVFEYRLDDSTIACGDCAERQHGTLTAQVRIQPTQQMFPISVTFERQAPQTVPLPKQSK